MHIQILGSHTKNVIINVSACEQLLFLYILIIDPAVSYQRYSFQVLFHLYRCV